MAEKPIGRPPRGGDPSVVTMIAVDPIYGRQLVFLDGLDEIGRMPLTDWMLRCFSDSLITPTSDWRPPDRAWRSSKLMRRQI